MLTALVIVGVVAAAAVHLCKAIIETAYLKEGRDEDGKKAVNN